MAFCLVFAHFVGEEWEHTAVFLHLLNTSYTMPYAICIWQSALWLMTFCFVVAHSVGRGRKMPRFLVFVELSILHHVVYAYGVLSSVCSLCEGRVVTFYFDVLLYSFY